MSSAIETTTCGRLDWVAVARDLVPSFASRASRHDAEDRFVAENFAELRRLRAFAAAVPGELGGGDASYHELAGMLRVVAHGCPSTALALAMHTHVVATAAWRWRHEHAPVEDLLRRVAAEQLVVVTSGGSAWLAGSGSAERVDGGWRVTARKVFVSGAPAGDLLMTTAVCDDPADGPTVLHFGVPLRTEGVRILDTWHTLGMRGTGSHDIQLDGVFVPDGAVGARRPAGRWHHLYHVIGLLALPLISAVYVGIAECAREAALASARRGDPGLPLRVGEMENALAGARMALDRMLTLATTREPGREATSEVMIGRTLAARFAIETVERALVIAGGRAFYRGSVIERLFRDVQAARFHPLQETAQLRFTGGLLLGLEIDEGR
jgi:acyl-CoA dehydrogenase